MAQKSTYQMPDFEGMSRQLRRDFYAREKAPGRQAVRARFAALGVKVGAHRKKEEQ